MYGDAPQLSTRPPVLGQPHRWMLFVKDRRTGALFLRELATDQDDALFRHARRLAEEQHGREAVVVVGPKREG